MHVFAFPIRNSLCFAVLYVVIVFTHSIACGTAGIAENFDCLFWQSTCVSRVSFVGQSLFEAVCCCFSAVSHALEPSVLMEIQLDDGTMQQFEVSKSNYCSRFCIVLHNVYIVMYCDLHCDVLHLKCAVYIVPSLYNTKENYDIIVYNQTTLLERKHNSFKLAQSPCMSSNTGTYAKTCIVLVYYLQNKCLQYSIRYIYNDVMKRSPRCLVPA